LEASDDVVGGAAKMDAELSVEVGFGDFTAELEESKDDRDLAVLVWTGVEELMEATLEKPENELLPPLLLGKLEDGAYLIVSHSDCDPTSK